MATNTLLTPDDISKAAVQVLHEESALLKNVNKAYEGKFANESMPSGKIGDEFRIRKPAKYGVGKTLDITSTKSDTIEDSVTLNVSQPYNVSVAYGEGERTFEINDYRELYLRPAIKRLVREIEEDGFKAMAASGRFVHQRADYDANVAFADMLKMRNILRSNFSNEGDANFAFGNFDAGDLVNANSVLYNAQGSISKNYKDGKFDDASGFMVHQTESVGTFTGGTATDGGTLSANVVEGGNTVTVTGGTANGTLKAGQAITIAGQYAIDPETQVARNYLRTFTLASDVTLDGSGAGTLTLTENIYTVAGSGNTLANVSALGVSTAVVTVVEADTASKSGQYMWAWDKNALTFASVMPVKPWGAVDWAANSYDGIGCSFWADSNVDTYVNTARIDVFAGWKVIYPEWICSSVGKVTA